MSVQPDEDFHGYMEDLKQKELDHQEMAAKVEAHEIWRQTTWTGFFVRQLQAIGDHFSPFFATLMQTDADRSPAQFLFLTMLRVLVIAGWIAAAYAVAHVISMLIGGGREIIIEDEIIIEHDDDDDGGGNDSNNKTNNKLRRRSARSKKEVEN